MSDLTRYHLQRINGEIVSGYLAEDVDATLAALQADLAASRRREQQLRDSLKAVGRHPSSCPKGVGIGHYTPPLDAICGCGLDAALALSVE